MSNASKTSGKNSSKNQKHKNGFSVEKYFLTFIEKNLFVISVVLITLIGLIIRFSTKEYVSPDMFNSLLKWYNYYKEAGMAGLETGVGDYNLLYQFLIALMTYLPIEPLYAFKILSCAFDFVLAGGAFTLTRLITEDDWKAFFAYGGVLISPIVFMNSSLWGQCDVIYVSFIVLSLIYLFKEKYIPSFILLGFAFAFKLHAAFALPFYLFIYFYKKDFSILHFLFIPLAMLVSAVPAALFGRNIFDVFTIYFNQTGSYTGMAWGYPSIWYIFDSSATKSYESLKSASIYLTIAVLAVIFIYFIIKKIKLTAEKMIYILFLTSYTCVFFLPEMHERYAYLPEITAIIAAVLNRKMIKPMLLINFVAFVAYGKCLFANDMTYPFMGYINVIAYFISVKTLFPEIIGVNTIKEEKQ